MGVIQFRGIIIKEQPAGESDKLLTFYTKEHSRLFARAKGARKLNSKLMAGCQLFCYGDFAAYCGNGFISITQADIIESFYMLRTDYDKLMAASCIMEVIDKSALEASPAGEELPLTLRALQKLCDGKLPAKLIFMAFLIKYLQIGGYVPILDCCSQCGASADHGFFGSEGMLCPACAKGNFPRPLPASLQAFDYVINSAIKNVFNFSVSQETLNNLSLCVDIFFENMEITINSREFLD